MIRLVPETKTRTRYQPDVLIVKTATDVIQGGTPAMRGRTGERAAAPVLARSVAEPLETLRATNVLVSMVPVFAQAKPGTLPEATTSAEHAIARSIRDVGEGDQEQRGVIRVQLRPGADVEAVERMLRNAAGIERVERAPRRWAQARKRRRPKASAKPDPYTNRQWGLRAIKWFEAHPLPKTSNVRVAVLDTGVDTTHPDLAIPTSRYHHADLTAEDIVGHGTHVSGIISAIVDNGVGIAGVCAPELHVWKIFSDKADSDGEYYVDDLHYFRALRSVSKGAFTAVNLSIGGFSDSETERQLMALVIGSGCAVSAAMGNEFNEGNPVEYPAAYPDVIAVGAITQANRRASFSNTGKHIALCAPGVAILSTLPMKPSAYRGQDETAYAAWDGTSMATPFVTGSAALVAAKNNGNLTPADLLARLTAAATRPPGMPAGKHSVEYGAGVVNIDTALAGTTRRRRPPRGRKKR